MRGKTLTKQEITAMNSLVLNLRYRSDHHNHSNRQFNVTNLQM